MKQRISNGIPYLPDSAVDTPVTLSPRPLGQSLAIFVLAFVLLQWGWSEARDTWVERLIVHEATVVPVAFMIGVLSPQIPVKGVGYSLKAPGGGINILDGCEGVEIMFLLVAAFAATRMPWRHRLTGLALGIALVLLINQARILALFYCHRFNRELFDTLHMAVLPAVMVALTALYFYFVLHHAQRHMA